MNKLAKKILKANELNGFDVEHELGTYLMLIVSELGECLEADRNDKRSIGLDRELDFKKTMNCKYYEEYINNTVESELADAIIRILHYVALKDIDIDYHIRTKLAYNKTREQKHGKKY